MLSCKACHRAGYQHSVCALQHFTKSVLCPLLGLDH